VEVSPDSVISITIWKAHSDLFGVKIDIPLDEEPGIDENGIEEEPGIEEE